MKKSLIIFCVVALVFSFSACEKTDDDPIQTRIFRLTVASRVKQNAWHPYGGGWGFTPVSFWAKEAGDTQWSAFSTAIAGFEWEEGYEYLLTVKSVLDTRIMDSGPVYTLVSEDSKTAKNSEGIPDPTTFHIKNMTVASQMYTPPVGAFPEWLDGSLYWVQFDYSGFSSSRSSPVVNDYWLPFFGEIEGFTYEEGYEYVIEIRYDEQTNWRGDDKLPLYYLVGEPVKTQKESEGLPY